MSDASRPPMTEADDTSSSRSENCGPCLNCCKEIMGACRKATREARLASVERISTGIVFALLSTVFIIQVWEQVVKFYEGSTSQAVNKMHHERLPLPRVTFCLNEPYKTGPLKKIGLSARFFSSTNSKKLRINETAPFPDLATLWDEATYSDREFELLTILYSGWNSTSAARGINTFYNGRCLEWTLNATANTRDRVLKGIYIHMPANKTGFALITSLEDVPSYAAGFSMWTGPVESLDVRKGQLYDKDIKIIRNTLLSSEAEVCIADRHYSHYKCMEDITSATYLRHHLKLNAYCSNVTAPCWIPQVDTATQLKYLRPCSSWKEYHCMLHAIKKSRYRANKECQKSCTGSRFEIASRQSTLLKTTKNGKEYQSMMRLFYGTTTVEHFYEYKIYDLGTIVGTVGGTMGLFLGFSFFQCSTIFLGRLLNKLIS